jgi:hypothetical protein
MRHGMSLTAVLQRSRRPSLAANRAYAERCGAVMQSLHMNQTIGNDWAHIRAPLKCTHFARGRLAPTRG